eukprot:11193328-Lingulodinium_polyedra.AAC.1
MLDIEDVRRARVGGQVLHGVNRIIAANHLSAPRRAGAPFAAALVERGTGASRAAVGAGRGGGGTGCASCAREPECA